MARKEKKETKKYTFNLNPKTITEIQAQLAPVGGKLAPLVESLLEGFIQNVNLGTAPSFVKPVNNQIEKLEQMKNKINTQIKNLQEIKLN